MVCLIFFLKRCTMGLQLILMRQVFITWQHLHHYATFHYTNTALALWLNPHRNHWSVGPVHTGPACAQQRPLWLAGLVYQQSQHWIKRKYISFIIHPTIEETKHSCFAHIALIAMTNDVWPPALSPNPHATISPGVYFMFFLHQMFKWHDIWMGCLLRVSWRILSMLKQDHTVIENSFEISSPKTADFQW